MSVVRWLTLIPADEAREILAQTPPVGHEHVPLAAAEGRVLAHVFAAPDNLPSERRSVMDGFAVRAADVHTASELFSIVLKVVGSVPMGDVFHGRMAAGEAVEIATGGFLPADADAVVMVEQTAPLGGSGDGSGGGARVEVSRAVAPGANVVQPGEDLTRGEAVLPAGRRLRAADLALLATFGVGTVEVFRRPRVAVLSTGNELCPPEATPRPGQVRDANQIALAAQIAAAGCDVTRAGIVPDDAAALRAAVHRLLAEHDVVILSGGSSIGTKDIPRRGARRPAAAGHPVSRHRHPSGEADAVRPRRSQAGHRHARVSDLVAGGVRRLHPPDALAAGGRNRARALARPPRRPPGRRASLRRRA